MRIAHLTISAAMLSAACFAAACSADNTRSITSALMDPTMSHDASRSGTVRLGQHDGQPTASVLSDADVRASRAVSPENSTNDGARARFYQLVREGPLALVLVDRPLAAGAAAEIYLNASEPLTHFMVIPRQQLNDELIDRAIGHARAYQLQHPDDQGEVTISLRANGDFIRTSKDGQFKGHQKFEGHYSNPLERSAWLLESAHRVTPTEIPRVGSGRVMSLGTPLPR